MTRLLMFAFPVVALIAVLPSSGFSQTELMSPVPEQEAQSLSQLIAGTVMSPYCPGRTLSACPSSQARDLRLKVLDWSREGMSRGDIEQTLINLYGFEILGVPDTDAVGLLGWYAPLVFMILGGALLIWRIKSLLSRNKSVPADGPPEKGSEVESTFTRQIEQELYARLHSEE